VRYIKNIGFPVDEDTYVKLKILCLKKNVTLKEFMLQLIKDAVKEQEDRK
jgi:hypothetical protein